MGIINQLSPSVINQIAAGEVVERPASVVKELLENAIDAGATRIELAVERGGKDLIRVADDGVGMDEEDLLKAFLPHATSKLATADDLTRIQTLGFRGEALAAIAEIAKVRCQTRPQGDSQGRELTIEAGEFSAVKPCGCPPGTIMEVRNLFFNTPVRRTFLKSDSTELGHVVEAFSRVALARPEIHMTLRSAGRTLHDLPTAAGTRERIAVFFGRELAESLIWVEGRFDQMHLWGYVGHPSQSRSTAKMQFLFLGGRYVRDRSLTHALNEAYRGLLMVGRMPVAFLHLDLPPEEVDVNVHPTKVEVRFRDSQRIYSQLLSTLRQTFLKSDLHARLQPGPQNEVPDRPAPRTPAPEQPAPRRTPAPERSAPVRSQPLIRPPDVAPAFGLSGGADDRQEVASWFESQRSAPRIPDSIGQTSSPTWAESLSALPTAGPGDQFDEFAPAGPAAAIVPQAKGHSARAFDPAEPPAKPSPLAGRDSPEPLRSGGPEKAIQLHNSYLIVETGDGMMVIDQHALHERILYEELRERVNRGPVEAQRLLAPEPVELPAAEAALVLEQAELLATLGVEIEPFGGDTVLVRSLPTMLSAVEPGRLVRDLAEHLRTQPLPPSRDAMLAELLHMVACKAAVKAGDPLAPEEIAALLARRQLANDSHHCPHGRPTALVFTKSQLEKQFGRV